MNPFFVYLIKSTISLALFYFVFKLAVSRDKMHKVNRFVLLGILITSAILPFAEIPVLQENRVIPQVEVFSQMLESPVFNNPQPAVSEEIQTVQPTNTLSLNPVLLIYLFAIILLFVRLIISLIRVFQLIKKAEKQSFQNYMLAVVKDFIQPFSFLRNIVISEKDYTENKEMVITHEYAHIRHFHAVDLVICELFTALHWFNPFVWLLRRDLKLIHEYQADQAVLNKGIDATKYQLLVIEKAVGERRFAMANHFTQKPILKRIKMMHKKNKKQWTWVKIILFIPALILLLQAFARPDMITKTNEFIPATFQEDQSAKWLEKWTFENIGNGFFQPEMKSTITNQKPNNRLTVLMNMKDEFLIENERAKNEDVKSIVLAFLKGKKPTGKQGPDFVETEISLIGKVKVNQGVIAYQHDLKSSKEAINSTLKSIGEAFLEARQQKSKEFFNESYFSLSIEKREAIDLAVPVWFSVEKPKMVKKTASPPPPPKFVLKLYQEKVTLWNEVISMDEVSTRANEYIKKVDKNAIIRIEAEKDISEERKNQIKEELRKAGALNINFTEMK
jgi:biopolymer transport protein ExbD